CSRSDEEIRANEYTPRDISNWSRLTVYAVLGRSVKLVLGERARRRLRWGTSTPHAGNDPSLPHRRVATWPCHAATDTSSTRAPQGQFPLGAGSGRGRATLGALARRGGTVRGDKPSAGALCTNAREPPSRSAPCNGRAQSAFAASRLRPASLDHADPGRRRDDPRQRE